MTGSPTLPWQAGEGRQRLLAAALANSAFDSVVSAEGSARTNEEEILSLWRQAQAALVLLGRTKVKAFSRTLALVFSLASTTLPRVSPVTEP